MTFVSEPRRMGVVADAQGFAAAMLLSSLHSGALAVLLEWNRVVGESLRIFDHKGLYDERIWELYELCDQDIMRFAYHVQVELPDQATGKVCSIEGLYADDLRGKEFFEKRRFGEPGSFWALENPPTEKDYTYPIW